MPRNDGEYGMLTVLPTSSAVMAFYRCSRRAADRNSGPSSSLGPRSSRIFETEEAEMKLSIVVSALLITGVVAVSTERASAAVYCEYIEYPAGCVVRRGVAVAPTRDVRKIPRSIDAPTSGFTPSGFILRQDLFDRNDPNNLRSDYHGPPAQPGQF